MKKTTTAQLGEITIAMMQHDGNTKIIYQED